MAEDRLASHQPETLEETVEPQIKGVLGKLSNWISSCEGNTYRCHFLTKLKPALVG